MGSLMKREAEKFLREKKRHRRWLAIVLCLALLVSSGTFAALRMNGRAMDEEGKALACQYQPHVHGEECYGENNELICGQADYVVHQHSMECYDAQGSQVCPLEERLPHVHDSSCYIEEDILTCELEESEGHQHTGECYGWDGAAICGYAEGEGSHQHTEECCSKESRLVCGELELHTHDDTCYDVEGNLICRKTELKEHVHNEECFIEVENQAAEADNGGENPEEIAPEESQAQTHVHDESCYEEAKIPACGQEESNGHQHAEECYGEDKTLICGQEEGEGAHQHTDACYSVERTLTCGYTGAEEVEETVSQEGSGASETPAAKQLQYHVPEDNVIITVEAQAGVLPDNAGLKVVPIRAEEEETQEQYESVKERLEEQAADEPYDIAGFLAYDISIMDGETEIEPSGEVKVTMDYQNAAIPEEIKEEAAKEEAISQVEVVHLKETDGDVTAEKLDNAEVALTDSAEVEKAEFVTDSFSTFVLTWTKVDDKGGKLFSINADVHAVEITNDQSTPYNELSTEIDGKELKAVGTPPTLYMDSISSTGKNSAFYEVREDGKTYRFQNAYIAKKIGAESRIELSETVPVIALQAMNTDSGNTNIKIRYLLEGEGEYKDFNQDNQDILFGYVEGPLTTKGGYYRENGEKLTYNNEESYDFSANDSFSKAEGCCVTKEEIDSQLTGIPEKIGSNSYSYITIQKGEQVIEPTFLRYVESVLQYSVSDTDVEADNREWRDVGTGTIRLVYKSNETVETVNTAGIVDIDLFKYKEYANSPYGPKDISEIKKGADDKTDEVTNGFQFIGYYGKPENGGSWYGPQLSVRPYPWNRGTNDLIKGEGTRVLQGIVEDQLANGYPKMKYGSRASLGNLFQTPSGDISDTGNPVKLAYTGLNHLFQVDAEGYYTYNSADNYAYIDKSDGENRNFTVYKEPGSATQPQIADTGGNFFPFIDIDKTMNYQSNTYESSYHFGMHVSFDFVQPENGKIDGKDMVFEFSGDDDVWVFVDDELLLDLGGCHDAAKGTINFATGSVNVPNGAIVNQNVNLNGSSTTFKTNNGSKTFTKFADGTKHHLDFFYLERGRSKANCSIKFNLQPQKKQTIEVGKEVIGSDQAKFGDAKFRFKLYLEKSKNSYSGSNKADAFALMPQGTEYQIKEDGRITGKTGTVGENGEFELMHNQSAVFSNIDPDLKYYVQEVSVASSEFDVVKVPGMNITYSKGDETPEETGGALKPGQEDIIAESSIETAGQKNRILFQNTCSGHNLHTLSITKRLDAGTVSVDGIKNDTYSFQVYLEDGLSGKLVPYAGDYYLTNSAGTSQKYSLTEDKNGVISGISADSKVEIREILSGTDFFVREVDIADNYDMPEETVTGNGAPENESGLVKPDGDANSSPGVYGVIDLDQNVSVEITNSCKKVWQVIKRNGNNTETLLTGAEFTIVSGNEIQYYGKSESGGIVKWGKAPDDLTFEMPELPEGTYTLKETKAPEGYALSETEWEISIGTGGKFQGITIGDASQTITPQQKDKKLYYMYYFDNTRLYELPETGGTGIYWYLVSGMLLMMAGTLILYKNRYKGVVRG